MQAPLQNSFSLLTNSIFKSFSSLTVPGSAKVFIKSILITIFTLIIFIVAITYLGSVIGSMLATYSYAHYFSWIAGFGSFIIAWVLFPGIMPFIIGFYSNDIIDIIEHHDYPNSKINHHSFINEFIFEIKFSLKAILYNILVLPLYLIPVINIFLFLMLNGHLLGKQFYLTIARRHVDEIIAQNNLVKYSRSIFLGGVLITFLATVPIINLIVPFLGLAIMVHLFHNHQILS